ncbi:MAG: hypothetical protein KGI50_05570 [Patescibacteria group bacterium]|nr:hypothetical protein [Patescibacteria group bacterium]MDE2438900.1 hypothetical protein [Patescibacteria group bacterium]
MNTSVLSWWIFFKLDECPNPEPKDVDVWLKEFETFTDMVIYNTLCGFEEFAKQYPTLQDAKKKWKYC